MERFCRECGSPVREGASFCRNCGAAIESAAAAPVCAGCGAALEPTARFCPACGTPAGGTRAQSAPAPGVPVRTADAPRTTSSRVGAPPRPEKKRRGGAGVIALVLVAALLITGFGWPGWLRSRRSAGPDYRMDGAVMELKVAAEPATELVYQAGMSAVQAYVNARLLLEKLTRTAHSGAGGKALEALANETTEAWRIASEIATATAVMASQLERSGSPDGPTLEAAFDALSLSTAAYAAEPEPEMLEWAKKITEMYDAAPAGQKVRTLAQNLGLDARQAYDVLQQTQAVMKGHYDQVAESADTWYKACMVTKTACKVVAVGAAVVATGGTAAAAGGVVGLTDAVLLTGSAVDCLVEAGDTTVNIVCGEDSQAAADYAILKNTVAPITGTIGAAGVFVGSWSTAIDKAGQLIYISDSANDLMQNGKILGVELPAPLGDAAKAVGEQVYKLVPIPTGEDAPSKMSEDEVKRILEKLDLPAATAEELASTPASDAPEAGYMTLEELPNETLEQLADDMLPNEEMEQSFDELFESFEEETGVTFTEDDFRSFEDDEEPAPIELPDDPEQWQDLIDELFPTDDLIVQEGDDEGFDDPSSWVKPDMPGEDWGEPEEVPPADEEEPEDDYDEPAPADEGLDEDDAAVYDLVCGTYSCTETATTEWFEDGSVDVYSESFSMTVSRSGSGLSISLMGYSLSMSFDPETMTGTIDDDGLSMTFTFRQEGGTVHLHASGVDTDYEDYRDTITIDGTKN